MALGYMESKGIFSFQLPTYDFSRCFITLDLLIPDWRLLLDRDSGDRRRRQGIQNTFKVIIKVCGSQLYDLGDKGENGGGVIRSSSRRNC